MRVKEKNISSTYFPLFFILGIITTSIFPIDFTASGILGILFLAASFKFHFLIPIVFYFAGLFITLFQENITPFNIHFSIFDSLKEFLTLKLNHPILIALATGNKRFIPSEIYTLYQDTGIAHILAISGLHLSLVCGFTFIGIRNLLALFPNIALRLNIKKISAVIALFLGIFYFCLAQQGPALIRAFLMACFIFIAVLLDRRVVTVKSLFWIAFLLLLFNPSLIYSAGFQLSFLTVFGLITFYKQKPTDSWIKKLFIMTFTANIITIPIIIYHFNQFSPYSILTNMIIIPLFSLITMPSLFIGIITSFLKINPFLFIAEKTIDWITYCALSVRNLPYSLIYIPQISSWLYFWIILSFVLFGLFHRRKYFLCIIIGLFYILPFQPSVIVHHSGTFAFEKDGIFFVSKDNKISQKWAKMRGLNPKNSKLYLKKSVFIQNKKISFGIQECYGAEYTFSRQKCPQYTKHNILLKDIKTEYKLFLK